MHWKGVAYGRDGESLKPLNQAKQDAIRRQPPLPDWTAQLVPNATINDLDELALATARVMFKKVHSSNIPGDEVDAWSKEEFLSHSMMMRDGQLTRAAILLLGKPLFIQKIYPAIAQITWTWQDEEGIVQDYEHFTIPFILTVDKVLSKIRNKTMRELPGGTLFPDTMKQYDEYTIREAMHNAIAHQDYTLQQCNTKEKGLNETSIQKLVLQLAHNAGDLGFKRKDVFESLQHVLPSSYTHDEKLRKIGNLLRKMAKDGFIIKASNGKQWNITTKGEQELS